MDRKETQSTLLYSHRHILRPGTIRTKIFVKTLPPQCLHNLNPHQFEGNAGKITDSNWTGSIYCAQKSFPFCSHPISVHCSFLSVFVLCIFVLPREKKLHTHFVERYLLHHATLSVSVFLKNIIEIFCLCWWQSFEKPKFGAFLKMRRVKTRWIN